MCGLTGILSSSPSNDITGMVANMTSLLAHRGPNDEGVWSEGNIGLGHRRLSVLDLSISGAQPMHSECKRFVISYNGEIYNHKEIRSSIEIDVELETSSDTEVLFYFLKKTKFSKLEKLRGIFSIVFFDLKNNLVYCARDITGTKPLYYLLNNDGFFFFFWGLVFI